MQQENQITGGNAKYQCYIIKKYTLCYIKYTISVNNYWKYSKHTVIEIWDCKNVKPSTDIFAV